MGGYYNSTYADTKTHLLTFPTEVGCALGKNNFAVIPYGGLNINVGLKGKAEIKDAGKTVETMDADISGDCGVSLRVGLRFRIYGFNLSASYTVPLNDEQKRIHSNKPYFGISVGYGF